MLTDLGSDASSIPFMYRLLPINISSVAILDTSSALLELINGSAIETVFSQAKQVTGGHLSAVNYEIALGNLATRRQLTKKHTRDQYRRQELYFHRAH